MENDGGRSGLSLLGDGVGNELEAREAVVGSR